MTGAGDCFALRGAPETPVPFLSNITDVSISGGATVRAIGAKVALPSGIRITLDAADASAATVEGLDFPVSGTLDVVNYDRAKGKIVLPVSFVGSATYENLKNWTVCVNGEESPDIRVRASNGTLKVVPPSGAQNLILNGDMGDEAKFAAECVSDGNRTGRLSLFSEEFTWNKCGKLEVVAVEKNAATGTDVINANAWIGATPGSRLPGFKVRPNTTYEFSIDLRGTPKNVRIAARTFVGDDNWKGVENRLTTVSLTPISEGWQTFRGTFKTGPKDVRCCLCVQMWSDTHDPKAYQYKLGDWVLFDNVSVRDRQGDLEAFAKRYGRRFAVAPVPVTCDMRVPFVPEEVMDPPEKIHVRAAVNELKGVPLALANLTGELTEYRVSLESTLPADQFTRFDGAKGLAGLSGSRVTLRKGLRFKDNDLYQGKLRIDPMPKMDEAQSLTVPAMEAGLVWVDIDTTDLRPGTYAGRLRVISLTDAAQSEQTGPGFGDYRITSPGQRDIPFELEVLPIVLDREPAVPGGFYTAAVSKEMFDQLADMGGRDFLLPVWALSFAKTADGLGFGKYRPQEWEGGDIRRVVRDHVAWGLSRNIRPRFMVGYGSWSTFNKTLGDKTLSADNLTRWVNWLKATKALLNGCGVSDAEYCHEIADEPKRKDLTELLVALKAAKKAVPEVRFVITFLGGSHPITVKELEDFEPYLDGYIFHDNKYLRNPGYHAHLAKLRAAGRSITHYTCSTRMTEDLDREFRQNAWMAERWDLTGNWIYQGIDAKGGAGAPNWKLCDEAAAHILRLTRDRREK